MKRYISWGWEQGADVTLSHTSFQPTCWPSDPLAIAPGAGDGAGRSPPHMGRWGGNGSGAAGTRRLREKEDMSLGTPVLPKTCPSPFIRPITKGWVGARTAPPPDEE